MNDNALAEDTLASLRDQAQQDIRDLRARKNELDQDSIDLILTGARSHYAWTDRPVTDDQLHAIYDMTKMGSTSMNGCPARFVFVRSAASNERPL